MTSADRAVPRLARSVLVCLLALLAVVGTFAAVVVLWAERTLLDTEEFVELVAPLVDDPAVQDAVAGRVEAAVLDALGLEASVPGLLERIHPAAVVLTGPVVNSAEALVGDAVVAVVESETFADAWKGSIEVAHTRASALLRDDPAAMGNLVVGDEAVTLDLLPLVAAALTRAVAALGELVGVDISIPRIVAGDDPEVSRRRLASALGRRLPDGYGQVTVMSTADLEVARRAYSRVQRLGPLLVMVSLALGTAAVWLASRRGRTVALLGVGVMGALLLARVVVSRVEAGLLADIADGQARAAVASVVAAVTSSASVAAWQLLVIGIIVTVLGILVGRGPSRTAA